MTRGRVRRWIRWGFLTWATVSTLWLFNSYRTDARWVEIEGGNHSQFGHYGRQVFDGSPATTREEQQAATRDALLDALRR